jgi:histidinol-phosphate aminotransferase
VPAADGPRLRAAVAAVPRYRPGSSAGPNQPPAAADLAKISSNENPYPPLPGVLEVVDEVAHSLNRYPDMVAGGVVLALAERLGVAPEQVVVGTGSVGVLGQVVQATCGDGDEAVYAWRSFEAYPILVGISGARRVEVPLAAGARHDLPAMADAVGPRTRLVLLCSPNNPTGPALRRTELEAFLDAVPPDVVVVLDEAYHEFVRDPEVPDGVELARGRPNVVVLRTFSKAYGLAGLRVGYAVADPAVADALRATAVPFGVSGVAQAAAIASLRAEAELLERVDRLVAERERLRAGLLAQGWDVPVSEANFLWLPLGAATAAFAAACADAGLLVRPFEGEGARVTVAETEVGDRLLEVCAAFRTRTS